MCLCNIDWIYRYFCKKEELTPTEIQMKRIKLLPFSWKFIK